MRKRQGKRHTPEQIIRKLREADTMLAVGKTIGQVVQVLEVSEPTFHRWRHQYGGMKAEASLRLKEQCDHESPLRGLTYEDKSYSCVMVAGTRDARTGSMHIIKKTFMCLGVLLVVSVVVLAVGIYMKITFDIPPSRNDSKILRQCTGVCLPADRKVYARCGDGIFDTTSWFAFQASQEEIDRIISQKGQLHQFCLENPSQVPVNVQFFWWNPPPKRAQHYRKEFPSQWTDLYFFPEEQKAYMICFEF